MFETLENKLKTIFDEASAELITYSAEAVAASLPFLGTGLVAYSATSHLNAVFVAATAIGGGIGAMGAIGAAAGLTVGGIKNLMRPDSDTQINQSSAMGAPSCSSNAPK